MRELAKIELGKHDSAEGHRRRRRSGPPALDKNDPRLRAPHDRSAVGAPVAQRRRRGPARPHAHARPSRAPAPRPRACCCYWRDRVPDTLALLQNLATDEHPRVRLEAVRAASFFRSADAADVALAVLKHPTDYYLDYTLKETMRQLEPYWRKALVSDAGNSEAMAQLVKSLNTTDLLKVKRTPAVWETILSRGAVADAVRVEALDALAEQRKTSRLAELLKVLDTKTDATPALARLLPAQLSSDLKANRARVAKLTDSKVPDVRQAAWAALAIADDSFDTIWGDASKSSSKLLDLLNGIPLINDPDFRGKAYDRVKPLLSEAKPDLHRAAIHAAVSMNRDQDKTFRSSRT